ncbi:MAG TPA: ATP-binding protein [Ferruginibacter sp.]|nr:ATP-binding protein [Ferruginibacter sp.]
MNQHLQTILDFIQQDKNLSADDKSALVKSVKDADKEIEITTFKLDRTEKVKRTTAILLEETIEELEQKRKAVEAQNGELEIESSLERVRTVAMGMNKPDDMLNVCRMISGQLLQLRFKEIRNVQTVIIYEQRHEYLNYQYFTPYDKNSIEVIDYRLHPDVLEFTEKMLQSADACYTKTFEGEELNVWREYRKQTNQLPDPKLDETSSSHYYFYSIGSGALGVTTYAPLSEEQLAIFKRFRNVFELAYRRFIDIEKAVAQAKEAQIETSLERVRAQAMAMRTPEDLTGICEVLYAELHTLGFTGMRNAMINIYDDEKKTFVNYDYSDEIGKSINHLVYNIHPVIEKQIKQLRSAGDAFSETHFKGKDLEAWKEFRKSIGEKDDPRIDNADALYYYFYSIGTGSIGISTFGVVAEEELIVLRRFRNVFNLAYQRYTDIELAEAQAKEAQIEAALERVRSRTMGMQKSEELKEVIQVVYDQFIHLNIKIEHTGFVIDYKARDDYNIWIADPLGVPSQVTVPYFDSVYYNRFNEAKEKGEDFFATNLSFEEKNKFYQKLFEYVPGLPEEAKQFYFSCPGLAASTVLLDTVCLYIENFSAIPYTDEENNTLMRFGKVFQQTYTRFLDLQKAEAQAREAQIELGLERVRARAMAMQRTDELSQLVDTVFKELTKLDFALTWCIINIIDENSLTNTVWAANPDIYKAPDVYHMKFEDYPFHQAMMKGWKERNSKYVYVLEGLEKKVYDEYLFNDTEFKKVPEAAQAASRAMEKYVVTFSFSNFGGLQTVGDIPLSDANIDILSRFGKVFDLTYTRFNDLQKAEDQSREAQIELALERVRARTMAMQKSEELPETSFLLFQQLKELGATADQLSIGIFNEEEGIAEISATIHGSQQVARIVHLNEPHVMQKVVAAWKANEKSVVLEISGESLRQYNTYRNKIAGYELYPVNTGPRDRWIVNVAFFSKGWMSFSRTEPTLRETIQLLERFAGVFDLTYTRFLDLQKAEAQAREAQIEASLERVRSKAMSMQKSEDLANAVAIVFEELDKLNLGMLRCGIGILNKEKRCAQVWTTTISENNTVVQVSGDESMDAHPLLQGAFEAWLNQEADHSYVLKGDDLNNYYKALIGEDFRLPDSQSLVAGTEGLVQYYYNATFSSGGLFAFREKEFPEEAKVVLRRFADVFNLTYTRFNDLKQAEAQAREAKIETALERVRSRTLAMQKSDELAETAAVLFRQLINLGIAPNRLYISIIADDSGNNEFWVTDEDGSKVSKQFIGNIHRNSTIKKMYEGWKAKKKFLTLDMKGKELADYLNYLSQELKVPFKEGLSQKRRVQTVAYFSKGFIGMASPDEQPGESIQLLERFAAVFNLTFTRFNDLKVAEAHAEQAGLDLIQLQTEKKRAEDALTELRATQTQLIQSEKMASLGELTAGIAHEIQNPLNFVNNFSEVNTELIEEMKEEMDKGNLDEARAIANDIKDNEQKINHHGKRADAIVKGMLQHSRSSSGIKESTNINTLADEYLRLAYHGLRAKDKTFNATMKTDYDESIGNISIIPQDIGRVILNLITNAFYVVNEKKTQQPKGYEPTVLVSTKKLVDQVQVSVKDNGNGIPPKVLDKIFQPFFTTKPTGQGTGLGLSLSYDIVKAHGGELKVKSKEGEGAEFIIQLPKIIE